MIHNKMMNKFDEYDLKLIKSLHLLINPYKKLPLNSLWAFIFINLHV